MHPEIPPQIPPILPPQSAVKQRAPTLYAIIGFKLLKGFLLLIAALAIFNVRDVNLQQEFQRMLAEANIPINGMLEHYVHLLGQVSSNMIRLFVVGSVLYGAFSLVEGAGLILRAAWAGWMVIVESAIFVPLELWELFSNFSILVLLVLVLNVAIVWYLYANRHRLFHSRSRQSI